MGKNQKDISVSVSQGDSMINLLQYVLFMLRKIHKIASVGVWMPEWNKEQGMEQGRERKKKAVLLLLASIRNPL